MVTLERLQEFQQAVDLADQLGLSLQQFLGKLVAHGWSDDEIMICANLCPPITPTKSPEPIEFFDWANLAPSTTGIALWGDPGSGKTSSAIQLLGLLTDAQPAQIMVFDLHNEPGKWPAGPFVLDTMNGIVAGLRYLLEYELPARQTALRQGKRFPPIVWVLEELGGVLRGIKRQSQKCEDKAERKTLVDLVEDVVVELGGQGRKYGFTGFLINQAGNAAANGCGGLGDYLEGFHQIRLGRIAQKYARQIGVDRAARDWLSAQAYPCLVGDMPAAHPTHSAYRNRAKGQPPQNLLPIYALDWKFPAPPAVAQTVEISAQAADLAIGGESADPIEQISVSQWREIAARAIGRLAETETKTSIVTDVLGFKGRRYAEGVKLLEAIASPPS